MYMGDYANAPVQADCMRECLKIARQEDFTLTVQAADANTAADLIENIAEDLKSIEGMTEKEARDIVTNHLNLLSSSYSGYEWAEDNKFSTVGGDIKTFPSLEKSGPDINDSAIDKTQAFTTGYSAPRNSKSYT